jgi:signal recognition particle subunit SRP54
MGKIKKQLDGADLDNGVLKRQMAIISSMTPAEKRNPKVMNASRKRRIASGSGAKVEDVNKLLKMHRQMADMMKMMSQRKGVFGKMMGGGGMPSETEMAKMQAELAGLDPSALPPDLREVIESAGASPRLPAPGLPGLGGMKLPGLGGMKLPGLPGKKR